MSYTPANSSRDLLAFFGALVAVFGVVYLWMRPWRAEPGDDAAIADEGLVEDSNGC